MGPSLNNLPPFRCYQREARWAGGVRRESALIFWTVDVIVTHAQDFPLTILETDDELT